MKITELKNFNKSKGIQKNWKIIYILMIRILMKLELFLNQMTR